MRELSIKTADMNIWTTVFIKLAVSPATGVLADILIN